MNITPLTPNTADRTFRDIAVAEMIEAAKVIEVFIMADRIKTLCDACVAALQLANQLEAAGFDVPDRLRMFATPAGWNPDAD